MKKIVIIANEYDTQKLADSIQANGWADDFKYTGKYLYSLLPDDKGAVGEMIDTISMMAEDAEVEDYRTEVWNA